MTGAPPAYHCASPEALAPAGPGRWRFRLYVPRGTRFEKAELVLDARGNQPWHAMAPRRGRRLDYYEVVAPVGEGIQTYRFRVQHRGRRAYLDADGWAPYRPGGAGAFRFHPTDAPPAWPRDQVFYQVFPDRFRRGADAVPLGDLADRGHGEGGVPRPWGAAPDPGRGWREFYGGDLTGVAEALPYLADLGVSALYLNPVFAASSVHRYDTKDYREIDPLLGGLAAYERLVDALEARGMRLVLDGVFNHTGDEFAGFDPALAGPRGGWYTPAPGGGYMAWWAVDTLPKLDYANPEVAAEIYAGEDAVVRRWLRGPRAADGWRLDVPACLGEGGGEAGNLRHLRGILDAARAANPEAYVFGEHFEVAGPWLDARVHDAVMNYSGFTFPTTEWLAGEDYEGFAAPLDAADLAAAWRSHRRGRTRDQRLVAYNLLSSHDMPRLLTRVGGRRDLAALGYLLLFTFPGVPSVYYGDEVGMAGGPDPDCRRTFPWDEAAWDRALRARVRDLARLRRDRRALREGSLEILGAGGDTIRFARVAGEAVVLVGANRGDRVAAADFDVATYGFGDETWVDALTGEEFRGAAGRVACDLAPAGGRVLIPA